MLGRPRMYTSYGAETALFPTWTQKAALALLVVVAVLLPFSLPVIDAALGLKNIRSVICLGNTWTARRYPMTLQRHWPEVETRLITVDSFATPRALWHTDPEFRVRMLREWDKIEPYMAKGFIAEWPVT